MNYCLIHKDDPCLPLLESCVDAIKLQMRSLTDWFRQPNRPRSPMVVPSASPDADDPKLQIPGIVTTGWHREDIITMTEALVRIRRSIEVLGHRLTALEAHLDDLDLASPMELLEEAVDVIALLVKQLRDVGDLPRYQALLDGLVEVREAMEKLQDDAVKKRGHCSLEPLKAMAMQELRKAFDETVECCELAGHHIYKLALSLY